MTPEDYIDIKMMVGKLIHGLSFRIWPHGKSIPGIRILHSSGHLDISSSSRDVDGWNETGELYVNRSGNILADDEWTSIKNINIDNFTVENIYIYTNPIDDTGSVDNSVEFEDSNHRKLAIMSGAAPHTVAIESNFVSKQSTAECDLEDMTRVDLMEAAIKKDDD